MSRSIVVTFGLFFAACGGGHAGEGAHCSSNGDCQQGLVCGSNNACETPTTPHGCSCTCSASGCTCTGNGCGDGGTASDLAGGGGGNMLPPGASAVFVTSATYTGELGGESGADSLCNAAASAAGLQGTFVAWIATSTDAYSRIADASPWYRLDGTKAFSTASQLRTQPLVPINVDENGASQAGTTNGIVWTGAMTGGAVATSTCQGWSVPYNYYQGQAGDLTSTSTWTSISEFNCDQAAHLYCFGQPGVQ